MATYYVSPYGLDTNNGLGSDPNGATNKPVASLNGLIGTSGIASPGDLILIAPGVYRGAITVGISGSSGSPINIQGDPGNSGGFKDSSGALITPGGIRLTSFDVNDTTTPTAGNLLNMPSISYLNFSNIWFVSGLSNAAQGALYLSGACHDNNFTKCMFSEGVVQSSSYSLVSVSCASSNPAMDTTFDRCIFFSCGSVLLNFAPRGDIGSGDVDCNAYVKNCLFIGGATQINIVRGSSGGGFGGGFHILNCTMTQPRSNHIVTGASISATIPTTIRNSVFLSTGIPGFQANASGQITEDYNVYSFNPTLVSKGSNSKLLDGSICPLFDVGQWSFWDQYPRPFLTPTVGSPILGYGNDASGPGYDFLNRPRPEGGKSINKAIGYLERHDTGVQENTIVDSGSSIRLIGPSSQQLMFPVNPESNTVSIKCYYDTLHGTGTPPQISLMASSGIGIADNGGGVNQTVTAPTTTGTWNTLTLSPITPTAKGVLKVLLINRSAAASGNAYFDTFAVS